MENCSAVNRAEGGVTAGLGFHRAGALLGKGRLIQRYSVLVFGTSRPFFIS
jgi:hypothetical protein